MLSLFFTSTAFAQYDYLDDTPCNKNNELSVACSNYIQSLDAEGLYTISKKFLSQYKSKVYPKPDNFGEITALRKQLMDKSSSLGHYPAVIEKAYEYENSGKLKLAEEYFRKAEKLSGRSFKSQIRNVQQLSYLRLILLTISLVILALLFFPLIRKRKWKKLYHRFLVLTPYFVIAIFITIFVFSNPDGRTMSPIIHKFVHLIDIRIFLFTAPIIVAVSYYYLISKRLITKRLVIINLIIFALAYVCILLLLYAFALLAISLP